MVADISGSGLTGLRTQLSVKKKCIDNIYSCKASYKKPKKSVANGIVDLSAGLLSLVNIDSTDNKLVVSSKSEVGSIESNINGFFDLKNMKNMIVEETSYTDSDNFVSNKNMDETTPQKLRHGLMY